MRRSVGPLVARGVGVLIAGACLALGAGQSEAALVNGDFSAGLTGWTVSPNGNAAVSGGRAVLRTDGAGLTTDAGLESFLSLTPGVLDVLAFPGIDAIEGTALRQTVTVNALDQLTFDWQFLTSEPVATGRDFAFVSITPSALPPTELAQVGVTPLSNGNAAEGYVRGTGVGSFVFQFLTGGTFDIGFGVVDVIDDDIGSGLAIDNVVITPAPAAVPEPSSMTLLSLCSLVGGGLAWRRRRTAAAASSADPSPTA